MIFGFIFSINLQAVQQSLDNLQAELLTITVS